MEVVLNKLFARSNVPKSEIEVEIHNDLRAIDHNLKSSVKKIIEVIQLIFNFKKSKF